ncbi:hypothetical protein RDI58_028300 [Solanum bulbocastanum]|uniref:BFN domain-containing protein n=1 Tax=Solanum bulbocastanum TaxID=147425 RepID=A0AAN8SSM4_SOLBU
MSSLQGPVVFPLVRGKKAGTLSSPIVKAKMLRSEFLGFNGIPRQWVNVARVPRSCLSKLIGCSFSSSSNDSGSTADNFNESDDDYVNSSVVEAVEVHSGKEGFMIKMRDGSHVKCVHNNPLGVHVHNYAPNPAVVLKMEDGTGLLLPIIVLEMSSVLLMAAVRNVQLVRLLFYIDSDKAIQRKLHCNLKVKLVRVTKREHETYLAQLHLTKLNNDAESISFDLRPSDAINIAVKCKVPIQVNKNLAYSDGVRIVESADLAPRAASSDGLLLTGPDKPAGQPSTDEKEFILVRNMLVAAVEERYRDAALWRDKLTQLRSNKNWT